MHVHVGVIRCFNDVLCVYRSWKAKISGARKKAQERVRMHVFVQPHGWHVSMSATRTPSFSEAVSKCGGCVTGGQSEETNGEIVSTAKAPTPTTASFRPRGLQLSPNKTPPKFQIPHHHRSSGKKSIYEQFSTVCSPTRC